MGRVGLRHRDVLSAGPRRGFLGLLWAGTLALTPLAVAQAEEPKAATPGGGGPVASSSASTEATAVHAVVGPVLVPPLAAEKSKEPLRRVLPTDPFQARAKELEGALREAAQDLGLALDLGTALPGDGARDLDLVSAASEGHWAISPRLEATGSDSFVLRLLAVPPKSTTALLRVEKVDGKALATRAIVMLRDLVQLKLAAAPSKPSTDDAEPRPQEEAGRSKGRPVLAASSTLLGLYAAYSIYSRSASDDPRLLYPLLALGGGIGLGASLLAAEEWDLSPGAAWTIAGGGWWGVVAGVNLAAGRNLQPESERPAIGLLGGLLGTGAAISGVALSRFDDGDAAIVNSGAALGLLVGSSIDMLHRGTLKQTPYTGLGVGTGVGLLGGGLAASFLTTSVQRVMLIDLGALLGALGGASLASPLVFREETTGRTRVFLSAVLGGTALGGVLAFFATRDTTPKEASKEPPKAANSLRKPAPGPTVLPVFGFGTVGLAGTF